MTPLGPPANLWSGSRDLGGLAAALSPYTTLARRRGAVEGDYPVVLDGRVWPDVEAFFQARKRHPIDEEVMATALVARWRQHPRVRLAVGALGGATWLDRCAHLTGAGATVRNARWEGDGRASRMVRLLADTYRQVADEPPAGREALDEYIGRPSRWGNPHRLLREGDRLVVLQAYLDGRSWPAAELESLRGRRLGCPGNCFPRSCHGLILVAALAGYVPDLPVLGN